MYESYLTKPRKGKSGDRKSQWDQDAFDEMLLDYVGQENMEIILRERKQARKWRAKDMTANIYIPP